MSTPHTGHLQCPHSIHDTCNVHTPYRTSSLSLYLQDIFHVPPICYYIFTDNSSWVFPQGNLFSHTYYTASSASVYLHIYLFSMESWPFFFSFFCLAIYYPVTLASMSLPKRECENRTLYLVGVRNIMDINNPISNITVLL